LSDGSAGGKEEMLKKLEAVVQEVGRNFTTRIFHGTEGKLTHPQFFMLRRLLNGPATVSEVAEYLGVSLSAVTAMADRLVKIKYITRKRSEDDRRLVWLELTDGGREVLSQASRRYSEVIYGLLGRMSGEDLEALFRVYTKLLELMTEKTER
jgi:DNA-binding MarR family transcriptional regulator